VSSKGYPSNYAVMPVRAHPLMTQRAVESVLGQDIPVIPYLIDNGSDCGSYLRSVDGAVVVSHQRPKGLHRVWNDALRYAFDVCRQPYVLVVNNDVVLRQDTYRLLAADGGQFVTAVGVDRPVLYSPEWLAAQDRVKISHFTRQGLQIKGVVHVGANNGYEIEHYLALGAERVWAFEPLYSAFAELRGRWGSNPRVKLSNLALSNRTGFAKLLVTQGDGQGSSLLPGAPSADYQIIEKQACETARYDALAGPGQPYNTLVIDVQGHELEVLQGFGAALFDFDYLNIECSEQPIYQGGAAARQIVDYLANYGFEQDSPICPHDDVMFIKPRARLSAARRPHPDFSCFLIRRECWEKVGPFDEEIYCFTGDGDYHLRMHTAGVQASSLNIPFFHESSGTLKYAADELRDSIAHQAAIDRKYFEWKWGCAMGSDAYNGMFR
jgi:FkbM family methyltransferase